MTSGITVAVPTHLPRLSTGMLDRALASVAAQTLAPAAISVAVDSTHDGAWTTRQRALDTVQTDWVAFLDSDDVLMPHHLATLAAAAEETGADYCFAWYVIQDRYGRPQPTWDPLGHFGKPWNDNDPHQTTITILVRTELAQAVGFHEPREGELIHGQRFGEDFAFTVGCVKVGAKIVHVPEKTWWWVHHGPGSPGVEGNTSGDPGRW